MSHSTASSVLRGSHERGTELSMVATCSFSFLNSFQCPTQVKYLTLFLINSIQTALFLFLFRGGIIHDTFAFRFSRSLMASFPSYCCLCPVPSPAGFCLYCFSAVVPHTAGRTLTVQHCDPLCARWICWSSAPQCLQSCYWLIEVNTRCFFYYYYFLIWNCSCYFDVTVLPGNPRKGHFIIVCPGFFFFSNLLLLPIYKQWEHADAQTELNQGCRLTYLLHWVSLHQGSETKSTFMVRSAHSSLIWHLKHEELRISREAFKTLHILKKNVTWFYFGSRFWILVLMETSIFFSKNNRTVWYLQCINPNFNYWCLFQINPDVFRGIELVYFQDLEALLMNHFTGTLCCFFRWTFYSWRSWCGDCATPALKRA